MANDSRARRHVNPWNPEVKTHTYTEWEHEFRDKLTDAGIPLDDTPEPAPKAGQAAQGG
jgi:hypothetical protein